MKNIIFNLMFFKIVISQCHGRKSIRDFSVCSFYVPVSKRRILRYHQSRRDKCKNDMTYNKYSVTCKTIPIPVVDTMTAITVNSIISSLYY